jgi:lipopolysaccharide assembly outer membrane protein LptD (OstA)
MELFGDPSASSGPSSMSGERVLLYYNDEGVERIVLPERGRLAESPQLESQWTDDSWIEGDSIVIHMSNDEVDSVQIFGNARAMYYPYEGTENKVSNNYSRGDSMFFRFDGPDLRYVRISGNASGTYNYLNLGPGESIDSLAALVDSSIVFREFARESEKISYEASEIEYFATTEDIVMHEGSKVDYQNKSLTAEYINFSSRLNILDAHGDPALDENGQMMYGYGMGYDMETEGGLVMDGSTKYDQGYYLGRRIFKEADDVLKVYGSTYTTCDYRKAHYSMRAGRMKVYIDDKIVSGPITLYIGEIPCFWLPFMVNSIRRGRQSGLLRPNFDIGINSRDGRFIRGIGYYWATNDYTDFTITTDFNENSNFRVHLTNRYKVRYMLGGNVNLDFFRDFNRKSYEWTFKSSHNQTFGKTASLRSNLSFVSSDEAPSSVFRADDVARVVDRRIYSTVSFNKSWGGTRLGLSASRNQKLNVSSDNPSEVSVSGTLPSLSLNLPRMSLWFGEKHSGSEKGVWESILREVTWSPNLKASRTTSQSDARKREEVTASSGASFSKQNRLLGFNITPSVGVNWSYAKTLKDQINMKYVTQPLPAVMTGDTITVPVTVGPGGNLLRIILNGWESADIGIGEGQYNSGAALAFELESSINSWSGWGSDQVTVDWLDNGDGTGNLRFTSSLEGSTSSIEFVDIPGAVYPAIGITPGAPVYGSDLSGATPDRRYKNEVSMRMSLSVGATLYGVFYPRIGSLVGIRHTFNPSIAISYVPALTENQNSSQGYSWSLRNVIDLKYLKDGEETRKNNALTWNMGGTYNPEVSERQFSNIRSSIRTSLGKLASISLNNTIDPYEREILSTSFSTNMNFGGTFSWLGKWIAPEHEKIRVAKELGAAREEEEEEEEEDELDTYDGFVSDFDEDDPLTGRPGGSAGARGPGRGTSWSFDIGYSYSGFGGSSMSSPTSKIDMRGNLNLTNNWKISFSSYFDIEGREFTSQQYSVSRDLHCWRAGFVHRRFGDEYSYYFQIQIKAHSDIQYEQGKRGLSGTVPGFLD